MNVPTIFENSDFGQVRAFTIGDDMWFVAKDVASALGYAKPRNAIYAHVDMEDRKDAPIQGILGGEQTMTCINESGIYSLVLSSKMEKAKAFKRWVTTEVIPSIRKHGAYATPDTIESIIQNPENGIKLLQALKKAQDEKALAEINQHKAELQVAAMEHIITDSQPKVEFAERIECSDNDITVRDMAQLLASVGWETGQNRFMNWLKQNRYIDTYNIPYQRWIDKGILRKMEHAIEINGSVKVKFTTRITGKGQRYFVKRFSEEFGIPEKKPEYVEKDMFLDR